MDFTAPETHISFTNKREKYDQMIPGPFTFWMLFRVAVHLALGTYFFVAIFRTSNFGLKLLFSVCTILMMVFAYNDWMFLRMNS